MTTQPARIEPLYSDERIARIVGAADFRHYEEDKVEELMRGLRDGMQREIDTLRATLAEREQWEPVEDGEYDEWDTHLGDIVTIEEGLLRVFDNSRPYDPCVAKLRLPDDIRLCRRKSPG